MPEGGSLKTCSRCGQTKPLDAFHRNKSRRDGRAVRCKECTRDYDRNRYSANRDRVRASQIKYKYGMTTDEYAAKLREQGGGCAICGKTPEENGRDLAVDHDHSCCPGKRSCGKCVRGLLCGTCNRGIGNFKDSTELLHAAVAYLRREGK